jgi:hypothetical protein
MSGSALERVRARWKGVYAVDGIGKVGPNELPPDIAALLAVAEAAQSRHQPVDNGEGRETWCICARLISRCPELIALAALEALP